MTEAKKSQRLLLEPKPTEIYITFCWQGQGEVIDVDSSVDYAGETINYINMLSRDNNISYVGNIEIVGYEFQQETFSVLLENISEKLTISAKIFEAKKRNQSFSRIRTFICIHDKISGEELIRFEFQGNNNSIITIGEVYPYNGSWKFRAIGQ